VRLVDARLAIDFISATAAVILSMSFRQLTGSKFTADMPLWAIRRRMIQYVKLKDSIIR
jgi:hypothetical protein